MELSEKAALWRELRLSLTAMLHPQPFMPDPQPLTPSRKSTKLTELKSPSRTKPFLKERLMGGCCHMLLLGEWWIRGASPGLFSRLPQLPYMPIYKQSMA